MTSFNDPTNSTLYTSVLSTIRALIASVAKMDFTSDTNLPTGTIRHNSSDNTFEKWNGSSWDDLTIHLPNDTGIGTTSPAVKLEVRNNTNAQHTMRVANNSAGSSALTVIQLGNDENAAAAGLEIYGSGNSSAGAAGGVRLMVGTARPLVFGTNGAAAARFDTSQRYLIGYTTSNGSYLLQVNSQIYATNATIATSDGRYKENVEEVAGALELVCLLRPVSFDWKEHPVHRFTLGRDLGFIAQDVEAALAGNPYLENIVKRNETELPDGSREEFLGLADSKLIPLLVGAVQDLKAKNDALEARLAALEAKLAP